MREAYDILMAILRRRGIVSQEDISEYLSGKPMKTYDPFLLHDMEAGVDLLLSEIEAGTKICIYGDYDADGVTSVCILTSVLRHLTGNLMHYIPLREDEGYGLNMSAVRKLAKEGVGMFLTVDCGSVSSDEVALAKELGMRVLVTDHHSIDGRKADCLMINPKQEECTYPYKYIAGCGVAFKLAQALQRRAGLPKSVLSEVLDLVAIGTVADVMPLLDENRTFVKYGLARINAGSRDSLKRLIEGISLKGVRAENIAYGIAPHINAAGRMADAEEAVKLFMSEDAAEADRQVEMLIRCNEERKRQQEDAFKRGLDLIPQDEDFIILRMDDIHEGVGGIVAGKLREAVGRPVVIVTPSGKGHLKGTGRSIETIDLYRFLKPSESLFERFGGHKGACGFLMKEENLPLLQEAASARIRECAQAEPHIFDNRPEWDMELSTDEISVALAEELERMEPFGKDNERPSFLLRSVELEGLRYMGDGTHAAFSALKDGYRAECVLFRRAQEMKALLESSAPVNLIGTLALDEWNGKKRVKLHIDEIIAEDII